MPCLSFPGYVRDGHCRRTAPGWEVGAAGSVRRFEQGHDSGFRGGPLAEEGVTELAYHNALTCPAIHLTTDTDSIPCRASHPANPARPTRAEDANPRAAVKRMEGGPAVDVPYLQS